MYTDYINMHFHSEYSNLTLKDSTNRIEESILYVANELGQKGYASTEHEFVGAHVKVLQTVSKLKSKGKIPQDFKVLLGNEIYLVDEQQMRDGIANKTGVKFHHFILIAKDSVGHQQLQEISSRAWSHMFNYKKLDRRPTYYEDIEEVVDKDPGHIIASTACLGGLLSQKILSGDYDGAYGFIEWCQDVFGEENFYLEMQPHKRDYDEEGNEVTSEQEIVNRWISSTGIQTIITTDAHYLRESDRELHSLYLKSDEDEEKTSSGGRETDKFYATTYAMSSSEIREKLGYYLSSNYIDKCFMNSVDIWSRCEEYDLAQSTIIPEVPLPPHVEWFYDEEIISYIYEHQENFSNIIQVMNSENDQDRYLMTLAFKGVRERQIPKEKWFKTFERLDMEMFELIGISKAKNATVSAYFVTLIGIIDVFWEVSNCILAPSRGSAAGWILNYLTGIVHQNPLEQPMAMPHWRFISAERPDWPDIDTDAPSYKRDVIYNDVKRFLNSFGSDIVRVGTFKVDKPKSAIQTACRAFGLSPDVGLFLSSFIKVDRGQPRSVVQTYYGDENEGFEPSLEFKREIDKYPGLLETAISIQGLVCGRGCHACGVIMSNNLVGHTALMKAPSGDDITQYDLADCEYVGLIKYDFLCTQATAMIQLTFEKLIENGYVEWQGTLRKTYNKFLSPDVLNLDNPKYYEAIEKREITNLFQFDTGMGVKVLSVVKPHSLQELAAANTLMRLQADGEQPMDRYVRIKANPQEWEDEMIRYGLNDKERAVLHKHLDGEYGVCSSQEQLMLLSMDENVVKFGVKEANYLRKSIAKKKPELRESMREEFFRRGKEIGTREVMLDYVWNVQFATQFGYSFSQLHTDGYSIVGIQEAELATSYPKIFWELSVLQVMSGAVEVEAVDDESEARERETKFGKLGGAIATLQKEGVNIALPNINKADKGFVADVENNSILYGLKGITSINLKTAETIISNRPYTSMKDFHDRLHLVKQEVESKEGKKQFKALISREQMVNLIKAGCFDELEQDKTRLDLLLEFLHWEYPDKVGVTTGALPQLIKRGLIPDDYEEYLRYYNFREYLRQGIKVDDGVLPHTTKQGYKVAKTKKWYLLDGEDEVDTQEVVESFFEMFPQLQEGKHWVYNENPDYYENAIWVESGSSSKGTFESLYKESIKPLLHYIGSDELLNKYNESLFEEHKNDEASGTQSSWEMETMTFYHSDHELAHLDRDYYKVDDFFELDEEPVVEDYWERKDKETGDITRIPKFKINQICGVVLDKNKTKHTVTLLTEYGVVTCKFVGGQFNYYDKQISMIDEDTGKNKVIEKTWFKRGTLLFARGIRNGDQFRIKTYKNGIYEHSLERIDKVYDDGIVLTTKDRIKLD